MWHAQWQTPAVAAPRPPTPELGGLLPLTDDRTPTPPVGAGFTTVELRARLWQTPAVAAPRPPTSGLGREGAAADGGTALGQRRGQNTSATQTEPNRSLPTLGDGDCDVDSFLEEFEEMVGLANDG